MTATVSAVDRASSWSWVTNMAVAPDARRMRRTSVRMVTRRAASRLAKGSSRRTTDGAGARARARATRCCWPPDSSWGMRSPSPARPASSSMASTRARPLRAPGQAEADVGRHRQVGEEGLLLGDDAHPAPLGRHVHAGAGHAPVPRRTTVPSSRRSKPATARSRVVLPQPDGPRTAVRVPASTDRSAPSRAVHGAERLAGARRSRRRGRARRARLAGHAHVRPPVPLPEAAGQQPGGHGRRPPPAGPTAPRRRRRRRSTWPTTPGWPASRSRWGRAAGWPAAPSCRSGTPGRCPRPRPGPAAGR